MDSPVISNYTIDLSSDVMQKLGPWEDEDQKNITVSPYTDNNKVTLVPSPARRHVFTTFTTFDNINTGYSVHLLAQ